MAIIKCKMCGGDIELSADKTYGTCDSCGSTMTFPKVDDEHRANLFNRANHFRRQNEFDKAVTAYERILNENNSDAEAHWGVVLSRFGIEYVEDPISHERIPTCHRVQVTSILTDADYLAALEYAPDDYSRNLYEAEAKRIADIQKGILAISAQEKPYDVFICYKESTDGGSRTKDSTLAQDIYYQLKQEGFNVFFARITLEEKLGQQYEPYIFAALNSAKVMLVVGTRPEHFNAVWVKNEWSRYLALMKQDRARLLIPCYRDMDAYDLPDELSALQSQDMSKIGFMQDLVRGVKKVLSASKPQQVLQSASMAATQVSTITPLLKRVFMFLEDEDWESADTYCEKVLDMDPENGQAYLGKLMAVLKISKRELLSDCAEPFDKNANYQKALRFGDAALKNELQAYIAHINERNENARREALYQRACHSLVRAGHVQEYKNLARDFDQLGNYKDAKLQAKKCLDTYSELMYQAAKGHMSFNSEGGYYDAIRILQQISGWRDADAQIRLCQRKIQELKEAAEAKRLASERAKEQARIKAAEKARKMKQLKLTLAGLAAAAIAVYLLVTQVIIPNQMYDAAVALKKAGKYEEAISVFAAMETYRDSAAQIAACETAIAAFEEIKDHKDSAAQASAIAGKAQAENLSKATVGSYVIFGAYEQDNKTSNGKEAIEWLVLAKENNRLLVISRYALDCKPYNTKRTNVTWETCTLRTWLNKDFLNAAFSSAEQAMIPKMTVSADKNPSYSTDPGKATQDKVFLLSITEANKYFKTDSARQCKLTAYADAQGAYADSSGFGWWWLRSPGYYPGLATRVYADGGVSDYGYYVEYDLSAVRPALWIEIAP